MPKIALLTAVGGPIELAEFPLTTPAPGTAALKLRIAGICGSDLHIFRGELALFYPFAMGHEMVCEITEVGEGVTTDATGKPLAVGDRVGADWVLEVVGAPGVIPDGIGFLNNGGTLLEVGNIGTGRTFELDPRVLVYGNKSVRGVMLYDPVTLAIGLSFLQHTSFPFSRLMPKAFHLTDVNAAFQSADAGLVPRGALVP